MIMNEALRRYVRDCEGKEELATCVIRWPKVKEPMVVWRGQSSKYTSFPKGSPIISTSTSRDAAITNFADKHCCLFKVTLQPGTPYLDVNKTLQQHSKDYEHEIIVPGNLRVKQTREPHIESGLNVYDIEYGPDVPPPVEELTAVEVFNEIPEDEISLWDTAEEIPGYDDLPEKEKSRFKDLFDAKKGIKTAGSFQRKSHKNGKKQQKVRITPSVLRRHTKKSKAKDVTKTAKARLKNRKNH